MLQPQFFGQYWPEIDLYRIPDDGRHNNNTTLEQYCTYERMQHSTQLRFRLTVPLKVLRHDNNIGDRCIINLFLKPKLA